MTIKSPCIEVCRIDRHNGLCNGCFRTLDEIASWNLYDDEQKARILAEIEERRLQVSWVEIFQSSFSDDK